MKKIAALVVAVISIGAATAQEYKIKVVEKSESFSSGSFNSFVVKIYESSEKDVEKAWKGEMKDMKAKVTSKKELFGDDATYDAMGDNSFDIYAKVKEVDGGTELAVAFDLGGAYLSSKDHAAKAKTMSDYINNFAIDQTKEAIKGILKEEEKNLKDLEKEQEDLVKDKEKLEQNIKDWEKDIEQAKKDIEENKKNQETKKGEITEQTKVVELTGKKVDSVK